jgi:hypothetical protein
VAQISAPTGDMLIRTRWKPLVVVMKYSSSTASFTGGFFIVGEGAPPPDKIVTNLPQSG